MKIAIIGTGYVGLVTGACFAEMGVDVTCVDVREDIIENLKQGIIHIYEPGLKELVHKNIQEQRLHFTTRIAEVINSAAVIFSAVGTPPDEDGSADLKYVLQVARQIGELANDYFLLVTKSTVPVGTADKVRQVISQQLEKRGVDINFDVASNPEFLKEGAAIKDFMSPDRVVVGTASNRAKMILEKLYKPFMLNGDRFISMDIASAEMTKYASNAMLATRISFMNEIAGLCELVGADVDMVRLGMGTDERIGKKFLYAGAGYGGSCFPKDVKALVHTGVEYGYKMSIIESVDRVNNQQKSVLFEKLKLAIGSLAGKQIAIWGLAFKPDTDDIREAPALVLIDSLLAAGASVSVFDPIAMPNVEALYGDRLNYSLDKYSAARGADAVVLVTEWRQFRLIDWLHMKEIMVGNVVVDGRNIYNAKELESIDIQYLRIGKR